MQGYELHLERGCVCAQYEYRGTSLIRNRALLGPYSRTMSRALRWHWGDGLFRVSEVPLCAHKMSARCAQRETDCICDHLAS